MSRTVRVPIACPVCGQARRAAGEVLEMALDFWLAKHGAVNIRSGAEAGVLQRTWENGPEVEDLTPAIEEFLSSECAHGQGEGLLDAFDADGDPVPFVYENASPGPFPRPPDVTESVWGILMVYKDLFDELTAAFARQHNYFAGLVKRVKALEAARKEEEQ